MMNNKTHLIVKINQNENKKNFSFSIFGCVFCQLQFLHTKQILLKRKKPLVMKCKKNRKIPAVALLNTMAKELGYLDHVLDHVLWYVKK